MIKVIIFDFDGVIVDSNALKHNSFFKLFPESDTDAQNITREVIDSIGDKTRFKILEQIFIKLKKSSSEIRDLIESYAKKYNEIVQRGIIEKGFVAGAPEALKNLSSKYTLYINSSTPEFALKETVERLGVGEFFKGVYGRPFSPEDAKESNLRKIISLEGASGKNILVVGDGEVDYRSARICGCHFIGIANEFNNWKNMPFPLLPDLLILEKTIELL